MRVVQTFSKQYSVKEQIHTYSDGPGIFKARFSERTAEVLVYQKLLFDVGGPAIFKAIFSDRTAEVHVYQKLLLMRMIQAYLKQYSVIE